MDEKKFEESWIRVRSFLFLRHFSRFDVMRVDRYTIPLNAIRSFVFLDSIYSANSFISSNQLRYTFCQKCFNEIPGDTVTLGDDPMQSQT